MNNPKTVMQMKILFDIYHLPQLNLFKNILLYLGKQNVIITCVNRGKLVDVIKHDLPDFDLIIIGDYRYNKGFFSMLFKIIIPRIIKLKKIISPQNISLVISSGYQSNIIAKIKRIPNLIITDDPRKYIFSLMNFVSTELCLPNFNKHQKKITYFNALKEWAYLSPKYFTPNSRVLREYDLKKGSYLFIREVKTDTINYRKQKEDGILQISKEIRNNMPVLLSLESKNNSALYPDNWIILKEPIMDIHSLMYYSKVVISSGDSMAREGAMLGVPSIYCGMREMAVNSILIDKGMLYKIKMEKVSEFINKIIDNKIMIEEQKIFRKKLQHEWLDVIEFIINKIKKYKG